MAASKTQLKTHVHRVKKSGPIWRCVRDNCRFFVYFKQQYVLDGKICSCWNCGSDFMFTEANFNEEFPTCMGCKNTEFADVIDRMERADIHKMMEDARKTDLDIEIEKLRNELTGDVDDDIVRQIAEQNLRDRANK